mmetsp:Transcript_76853/g.207417  ORF Transcript_76853/g.207417 Transcript_76853/m.207417 type:complete len:204 (+) Transcript_76853:10049-10660(+)
MLERDASNSARLALIKAISACRLARKTGIRARMIFKSSRVSSFFAPGALAAQRARSANRADETCSATLFSPLIPPIWLTTLATPATAPGSGLSPATNSRIPSSRLRRSSDEEASSSAASSSGELADSISASHAARRRRSSSRKKLTGLATLSNRPRSRSARECTSPTCTESEKLTAGTHTTGPGASTTAGPSRDSHAPDPCCT